MRARKLRLVIETSDVAGLGGLTFTSELVLHPDGTVTGDGVLLTPEGELAFAATGVIDDIVAPKVARG